MIFPIAGILLLGLPLLALAWLIRWDSTGPGIHSQTRLGLHGRKFVMFKLRTMHADAEWDLGPIWAVKDDSRCTRFVEMLRRCRIDELVQF